MPVWRAFIDDSGSDGAVLFPDFSKRPIDPMDGTMKIPGMISPVTTVGLVAFNTNHCIQVERELRDFRQRIQKRYSIQWSSLPTIHMRHLWGKNARHDNGKNPFEGLSEGARVQIVKEAYEFLVSAHRQYKPKFSYFDTHNIRDQDNDFTFFNSERQLKEREIIYHRFSKKKVAEKFFKLIMHSTMGLVSSATMDFGNFCSARGYDGVINYDDSDASKGFNANDLFDTLHEHGWALGVRYDSHTQAVNECLLQLADLISFYAYRKELAKHRGDLELKNDKFFQVSEIMSTLFRNPRSVLEIEHIPYEGISVHYLVGRRYLAGKDPTWVGEHLKTHVELQAEAAVSTAGGVPIIREASYQYYLKHGRLP